MGYKLELWPGGLAVAETRLGSMLQFQRAATTTGDFRSRLGYTKQACGTWLDRKKQQVARSPRLFAEYSKCEVIWTERDVSTLARVQAFGLDLRISQTSGGAINFG